MTVVKAYVGMVICIAALLLNLGSRWRWPVSFTPRSTYPREKNPGSNWIGGLMAPREILDVSVKRKICIFRGSNLYYTVPEYTILYCVILYYNILYYTTQYYTVLILYNTTLCCSIPYYTILYSTILYCTMLLYNILYYIYYTIL